MVGQRLLHIQQRVRNNTRRDSAAQTYSMPCARATAHKAAKVELVATRASAATGRAGAGLSTLNLAQAIGNAEALGIADASLYRHAGGSLRFTRDGCPVGAR